MEIRQMNEIGFMAANWPLDPSKSTLVFIHGAGGTANFWLAQVEGLAGRANTIAIDLPGHGRSEGDGYDRVEDCAIELADFTKALDAPGPIPCGLSLGGAITQQLLLDAPDLFKAGILINTGSKLRVATEIFDTIEKGAKHYVDMISTLVVSQATDPDRVKPFKDDLASCKSIVLKNDFQACDRFDVMQRLGSIMLPVLVVSAEDDQVTPPKYSDFMEEAILKASRAHILEAGHISPMEKPEEINRTITAFLDRTGL